MNPKIIEPLVPVDLVVDHSVQVDFAGSADALSRNLDMEFQRNRERYQFLKWGMQAFDTFKVVPPGIGIVHQVNLEYLAKGVLATADTPPIYYPDTLVGTDSHTTMINGLGIVGWGVGGIEAEAGMLGQPVYFLTPDVVGVHLTGALREGVTATDLALTVTADAAQGQGRRQVRRVLRSRRGGSAGGGPRHHRQHGPRIRRHDGLLPHGRRVRRAISAPPAAPRSIAAFTKTISARRASSASRKRATSPTPPTWNWTWPASRPAWPVQNGRRTKLNSPR